MTKVIKIDIANPDLKKIKAAAEILRSGGLVAFPTETVYGLGANALDAAAVEKIFKAKGRPSDNPMIVHISSVDALGEIVSTVPDVAHRLMERFWPGPLTLVLNKKKIIPDIVTCGLRTVAVRMPAHPVAHLLLKEALVPIAAPSANLSGRPSPTSAEHVLEDLDGKIDLVIDSGVCDVGLESSVVDVSGKELVLLRPGKITLEQLQEVGGKVRMGSGKGKVKSPGMKYKHYAPRARVVVCLASEMRLELEKQRRAGKRVGVLALESFSGDEEVVVSGLEEFARRLFETFRIFDMKKVDVILVEDVGEQGLGRAIMNRVRKAAGLKGYLY